MISKHCSLSGTNDKAGGPHYMLKWASPQVGCKCKSCFAKMQILFSTNANLAMQKRKSCKFEENFTEIFQAVKQTFVPLPSVSYPYMNQ